MGCLPRLPVEFPLTYPENAGNMVHANAPFRMFDSAFFVKDVNYKALGFENFLSFVNKRCSHLIVTMANTLRAGEEDGAKYARMLDFLSKVDKPIVVFGLGIQTKETNLDGISLPQEAVALVNHLSSRATLLGVRGDFTKRVLERLCGVSNAYVTGCPSLFSRPLAFAELRENIKNGTVGRPAYAGTRYFDTNENAHLINAIRQGHWLIEPVNKHNHNFYVKTLSGSDSVEDVPYFLRRHLKGEEYGDRHYMRNYFLSSYRLFRNTDEWFQFNAEAVSFSYGSRFHVNMATLLSGKPALWLTHDARTRELVEFMGLPNVDIDSECMSDINAIRKLMNFECFFDKIGGLFKNFNEYLAANDLPEISAPV